MGLRQRVQDPVVRLRIGAVSLVLASLAKWFLHSAAWQSATDGAIGLLYGVAIGFMLLSLRSPGCGNAPSADSGRQS